MTRFLTCLCPLGWLWAAPFTLLGLFCALPGLGGATWLARQNGCLVFVDSGRGLTGIFFRKWRLDGASRVAAITLGNAIILARASFAQSARLMAHESAHARQSMILGPFFPIIYFGHWLILFLMRHPNPYRAICLEQLARRASGEDL